MNSTAHSHRRSEQPVTAISAYAQRAPPASAIGIHSRRNCGLPPPSLPPPPRGPFRITMPRPCDEHRHHLGYNCRIIPEGPPGAAPRLARTPLPSFHPSSGPVPSAAAALLAARSHHQRRHSRGNNKAQLAGKWTAREIPSRPPWTHSSGGRPASATRSRAD